MMIWNPQPLPFLTVSQDWSNMPQVEGKLTVLLLIASRIPPGRAVQRHAESEAKFKVEQRSIIEHHSEIES